MKGSLLDVQRTTDELCLLCRSDSTKTRSQFERY